MTSVVLSACMSLGLWWWYFTLKRELRNRGYNHRWAFKTTLICAILVTILAIASIVYYILVGDNL